MQPVQQSHQSPILFPGELQATEFVLKTCTGVASFPANRSTWCQVGNTEKIPGERAGWKQTRSRSCGLATGVLFWTTEISPARSSVRLGKNAENPSRILATELWSRHLFFCNQIFPAARVPKIQFYSHTIRSDGYPEANNARRKEKKNSLLPALVNALMPQKNLSRSLRLSNTSNSRNEIGRT